MTHSGPSEGLPRDLPPDHDADLCRFVIEHIEEVIYLVDVTPGELVGGQVRFISPKVEALLGYEPRQFVDDSGLWFRSLHPDDVSPVLESTRSIFAHRKPATRLYRIRHRTTGDYHWVEDKVVPRLDASGEIAGLFGVARDVTHDLLAREALQANEARLRHLVESSPDAILLVAADGRITMVNGQTERMFGYDRKDLIGQSVELLVPERSRARHAELRTTFARNPSMRPMGGNLSLVARRQDGREFPVEISLSPLVAEAGLLTIVTVRDVAERIWPIVEASIASAPVDRPPQSAPTVAATILVVEQEDAVRELIATVLEREGYRMLKARHGAEAIVISRAHPGPIHLLMTDIMMPRAGGFVLAEHLSQDRPALRVLYACAPGAETTINLSRLDPGVALLEKPFTPARLAAKVRDILARPG